MKLYLDIAWHVGVLCFIAFLVRELLAHRKLEKARRERTGVLETPMYWCDACRSYHVDPVNEDHHAALRCRKPFKA